MDYFTISQDISLIHAVELDCGFIPEAWKKEIVKGRSVEFEFGKLPAQNHNFLVKSKKENIYPDLLEAPLPLLSTTLKNIFCSFENQIQCSCAILSDREARRQEAYWLFALDRIKCLGSKAEFYPNGILKKLVLNRDAIGEHSIFRVHGIIEKQIVIRFDVAESILRRPMVGIKLEGIECQEETDI